jgi:hypothetical protein
MLVALPARERKWALYYAEARRRGQERKKRGAYAPREERSLLPRRTLYDLKDGSQGNSAQEDLLSCDGHKVHSSMPTVFVHHHVQFIP